MTIAWSIIKKALTGPARTAIIDDRRTYTPAHIVGGALHVASEVQRRCQTDTLAVLLPTSGATPIAMLAGWMLGKTIVPLNYLLKPEELQYVIDDCGTDTIITVGDMLEFLGGPPRVKNLIKIEDLDMTGAPEPRIPPHQDTSDLAFILYTSGTSGNPKGVMLSHDNILANVTQVKKWVGFTPQDSILGVLPQFHSYGLTVLTILPLLVGMQVTYTARFVPHKLITLLRKHRPTVFVAIPSMYNALLHARDATKEDFASLRYVVSGGEPLPDAVFEGFREKYDITINEGYGLTETAPVTNWCRPDEWRRGSVGRPLPRIDQRIVDIESRRPVPQGHEGEILIAGPNVMQGYYKLPDETARAFEHGYFRTGDIGKLDAEGHLHITGRLKEMLIVGGENVFPREIEEVLNAHPSVSASAVIGQHDPIRGEIPYAFVELIEDAQFDMKALQKWCRDRLAGYKVPRAIEQIETLPRNPTGKILRRELKPSA